MFSKGVVLIKSILGTTTSLEHPLGAKGQGAPYESIVLKLWRGNEANHLELIMHLDSRCCCCVVSMDFIFNSN